MRLAMAIFFAIAALMPQRAGAAKVAADTLSIRDVFVSLQSEPVEILKKTTRLDMLDYWDADSVYKAGEVLLEMVEGKFVYGKHLFAFRSLAAFFLAFFTLFDFNVIFVGEPA